MYRHKQPVKAEFLFYTKKDSIFPEPICQECKNQLDGLAQLFSSEGTLIVAIAPWDLTN